MVFALTLCGLIAGTASSEQFSLDEVRAVYFAAKESEMLSMHQKIVTSGKNYLRLAVSTKDVELNRNYHQLSRDSQMLVIIMEAYLDIRALETFDAGSDLYVKTLDVWTHKLRVVSAEQRSYYSKLLEIGVRREVRGKINSHIKLLDELDQALTAKNQLASTSPAPAT